MSELENITEFKGLYSTGDNYRNPGAIDLVNVDIDLYGAINKAKGYTRVAPVTNLSCTAIVPSGTDTILYVNSTNQIGLNEGGTVILHDISNPSVASILEGKAWRIKSIVEDTSITLDGADISSLATNLTCTHMTYSGNPDWGITGINDGASILVFWYTGDKVSATYKNYVFSTTEPSYNVKRLARDNGPIESTKLIYPATPIPKNGDATGYFNLALGPLLITATSHGLSSGTIIEISGTINYDGQWPVTVIDDNNFTIDTSFELDEISTMVVSLGSGVIDLSLVNLINLIPTGGTAIESINPQGAFCDGVHLYSFIANLVSEKSYLCYTAMNAINWMYVEDTDFISVTQILPTEFNVTDKGYFASYNNNIIFTKNETISFPSDTPTYYGGTLYIDLSRTSHTTLGTAYIDVYGKQNNPTGKYLDIYNERLCVGGLSKIENTSVNGLDQVMISKFSPEPVDQSYTIDGAIDFSPTKCTITVNEALTNNIYVGATIFVKDVAFPAQIDDFNDKYYMVEGFNSTDKTITVAYVDSNELVSTPDTGEIILRGATWSPAETIYEDSTIGAGMLACDSKSSDIIMNIVNAFGALIIFRQHSIYFYNGNSLAKKINVEYGAVASDVAISSGGIWFISQYGLSKIEGSLVKTTTTSLDNIVTITPTENIKRFFDAITNKDQLILHIVDRYIWIYDSGTLYTYSLDLVSSEWTRYYGQLVHEYFNLNQISYSIYRHMVFKMRDGFNNYLASTYEATPLQSRYRTRYFDQGRYDYLKTYKMFNMLVEGTASANEEVPLYVNLYPNGSGTLSQSFNYNIKTGSLFTWDALYSANDTWDSIFNGDMSIIWTDLISGSDKLILRKGSYRLGTAKNIGFELLHNSDNDFKITSIQLVYDILPINTFI